MNVTVMHLFVYYNSTQSKMDGTWLIYNIITFTEFFIIVLSYPPVMYMGVLLFRHRLFHVNLQNVVRTVIIEYLTQLTSRSAEIFLIFMSQEDGAEFYYASLVRCTCYFFVSLQLPLFVIERCCASYFLSDYERKTRYYISVLSIGIVIILSLYLSYFYHMVESTISLHLAMLIINLFCSFIIIIIEKFNYKWLEESSNLRKSKKEYSLAQRFQISENIRVCVFMKTIINVVSIFNLLSTISAAMDNFDISPFLLNIFSTLFNICVLSYGSLVFFLFYYLTPQFRNEVKKILTRLRIVNPVAPTDDQLNEKPLKLAAMETDQYFDQLQRQWE